MGSRILILVDYRRAFWSSTRNLDTVCSLDVGRLESALAALGHAVEVLEIADLDLSRTDLRDRFVIYTSSEDPGAHYKRFIESKIFGLRMLGAHPIPAPELLLAHHDKVMMESVRQALLRATPGQLASHTFGTLEEATAREEQWARLPAVLKPASGAGSRGVVLIRDARSGLRAMKRLTRSFDARGTVAELGRRWKNRAYVPRSLHRRPVVVQELVPGLAGDYKVLRYGGRFYILGRSNRPNDFRASGSGRLDYSPHDQIDVTPILDAALIWSDALGSPYCSLDVVFDPAKGVQPHLIEFQCVSFGPATAENSTGYYTVGPAGWKRTEEACDLEAVFAEATSGHIGRLEACEKGT